NLFYAPWVDGHQFIYNMASWFLIPLFLVQVIAFMLLKPFADKTGKIPLTASVLFFIGSLCCGLTALKFGPQNEGVRNLTLMTLRVFYFIPSFALGLLYRRKLNQYDTLSTPLYCFILLSITALLCAFFPKYDHIPSWLSQVEEPPIVIYAICFVAILFWLRIAKVLSPLLEKSIALQNIANHTFDIMMHHFAGFMLIKAALSGLPNFNLYAFKNNIWYDFFPIPEELCAWGYIFITIVIALLTGFTSRWFYDRIKQLFYRG
ncbi:MAG: hypothetical protein J6W96_02525, partial [Alphaproteobacteria bacterium]|nr:hypothetical protein [Alphaproteobacteria bacterium]